MKNNGRDIDFETFETILKSYRNSIQSDIEIFKIMLTNEAVEIYTTYLKEQLIIDVYKESKLANIRYKNDGHIDYIAKQNRDSFEVKQIVLAIVEKVIEETNSLLNADDSLTAKEVFLNFVNYD